MSVEAVAAPPAVRVSHLSRQYGGRLALNDVSFEVEAGAVFGLVGPYGAGKTTLLRILATLDQPTRGEAWLGDLSLTDQHPANRQALRRYLGYLPTFGGLYEQMTVREYLDFFAAAYEIEPSRRAPLLKDLMELFELGDRQNDFVHLLPRAQAQRLALARALLHDPPLLLLDEPTVGLDFADYRNMRELLVELTKMGKTIMFTASAQDDLTPICTHLALLHGGRLLLAGSVADLQSGTHQHIKTVRLRLRPLPGLQSFQVQSLLFAGPHVQQVRQVLDTGEWQVQLAATADATAAFMHYLIRHNLPVYSFTEHALSLEELFQQALSGQPVAY